MPHGPQQLVCCVFLTCRLVYCCWVVTAVELLLLRKHPVFTMQASKAACTCCQPALIQHVLLLWCAYAGQRSCMAAAGAAVPSSSECTLSSTDSCTAPTRWLKLLHGCASELLRGTCGWCWWQLVHSASLAGCVALVIVSGALYGVRLSLHAYVTVMTFVRCDEDRVPVGRHFNAIHHEGACVSVRHSSVSSN